MAEMYEPPGSRELMNELSLAEQNPIAQGDGWSLLGPFAVDGTYLPDLETGVRYDSASNTVIIP